MLIILIFVFLYELLEKLVVILVFFLIVYLYFNLISCNVDVGVIVICDFFVKIFFGVLIFMFNVFLFNGVYVF